MCLRGSKSEIGEVIIGDPLDPNLLTYSPSQGEMVIIRQFQRNDNSPEEQHCNCNANTTRPSPNAELIPIYFQAEDRWRTTIAFWRPTMKLFPLSTSASTHPPAGEMVGYQNSERLHDFVVRKDLDLHQGWISIAKCAQKVQQTTYNQNISFRSYPSFSFMVKMTTQGIQFTETFGSERVEAEEDPARLCWEVDL